MGLVLLAIQSIVALLETLVANVTEFAFLITALALVEPETNL